MILSVDQNRGQLFYGSVEPFFHVAQYRFATRKPRFVKIVRKAKKYGCGIIVCMKSRDLKPLLDRAPTWPKGAKEEVIKALREIEEDFIIGPATRRELDRSHQEMLHGDGVSFEEIKGRLGI